MCCTRPDLAYKVGTLSRFNINPSKQHWTAIKTLMAYLKGTKDYAMFYYGHLPVLDGYVDASWNSEVGNYRSTSGFVLLIGGATVVWKSNI